MSAQVIRFPQVGALQCPVDAEEFRELNRIQLFPGRLNRWAMSVRVAESATPAEVGELVRRIFAAWFDLFPGRVDVQNVAVATIGGNPEGLAGLRAPFRMRAPQRAVRVDFVYDGPATEMGLPTFVQRRRERIDPLCPVIPLDAVPWKALEPGAAAVVQNPIERPERHRDPWDLGLPQIDPDKFTSGLKTAVKTLVFAGVGLAAGVLIYHAMRARGRKR